MALEATDITVEGLSYPLRRISRFITKHDSNGDSVFLSDIAKTMAFYNPLEDSQVPVGFSLGYTTSSFPAPLTDGQDLTDYKGVLANSKSIGTSIHGGTVLRCINYPPKFESPMHRTVSLDYGILIDGELDCVLDSGERRSLKPGDITIQRGTMHAWVNPSPTKWARMYYVLLDAKPVIVQGNNLAEDLGDLAQHMPSSH